METHIVHFKVGAIAVLDLFILDECKAQTGASLPVANDLRHKKNQSQIDSNAGLGEIMARAQQKCK